MDNGNSGRLGGGRFSRGLLCYMKGGVMAAVAVTLLSGLGTGAMAQEPGPSGGARAAQAGETMPSDAGATRPTDPTEAVMEAYNRKMQSVMDQADPFAAQGSGDVFFDAEALKNNKEYKKAMELYLKLAEETSDPGAFSGAAESAQGAGLNQEALLLADEALARYEKQYEAMLTKARAYKNLDQIPEARIMIEKAMETMAEDGTGIDAAVMDLYKEIMRKTSGMPDEETP